MSLTSQSLLSLFAVNPRWLAIGVGLSLCAAALVLSYRAMLPRPIPGIPYNKAAAARISGDGPDMKTAKRPRGWMCDQFAKHNSPIVQLFMSPLQKPWVLVSDFYESHDIMLRRSKEFDRSGLTADCFSGIMPDFQMNMKSADTRYKHNKNLVRDLMTPTFLTEVSAPELYAKMALLLDLWTLKASLAEGCPFRADQDIYMWALDLTMAVAFSFPESDTMMSKQISHLSSHHKHIPSVRSSNQKIDFETIPLDPELDACIYLANSVGVAFRSPVPRLAHTLYLSTPHSRRQLRIKRELIKRNIEQSLTRLGQRDGRQVLTCAVDQVLLRERERAHKLGEQPKYHKDAIYDELFGFIVGGHDTTSTTFQWWVKYMSRSQQSQSRMRAELYAAHPKARLEGRLPEIGEIASTNLPYLDAMIEEAFRYSHIVPFVTREAIVDTRIFGHAIPKGTQIMLSNSTESFLKPAFKIDDAQRANPTPNTTVRYGVWDRTDVGDFKPERWLKKHKITNNDGSVEEQLVFDPRSGPTLSFGAGPRGCFGRRLAYLEMRIAITMLIWSFEFLEMSGDLNTFESIDTSTEAPKACYVRLRRLDY